MVTPILCTIIARCGILAYPQHWPQDRLRVPPLGPLPPMDKQAVIAAIAAAFAEVTLGDGIGLWEAQAIDDYEIAAVRQRNRAKDEKHDWRNIAPEVLQRCHSSLSFFDADGMRFHLPAYLLASLDNAVDDPLFHLTYLNDYTTSRFTTLTDAQRQAIVQYLQWCLTQEIYQFDHDAIRSALATYWTP